VALLGGAEPGRRAVGVVGKLLVAYDVAAMMRLCAELIARDNQLISMPRPSSLPRFAKAARTASASRSVR
jgi:hypothetical protein